MQSILVEVLKLIPSIFTVENNDSSEVRIIDRDADSGLAIVSMNDENAVTTILSEAEVVQLHKALTRHLTDKGVLAVAQGEE